MKRRLWLFAFALAACAPFALAPKPAAADGTCYTNASTYATAAAGLLYFYPLCSASGGLTTTPAAGSAGTGTGSPAYTRIQDGASTQLESVIVPNSDGNNPANYGAAVSESIAYGSNFFNGTLDRILAYPTNGDAIATNVGNSLASASFNLGFNGSTWDRQRTTAAFGAPSTQVGVAAMGSICNASVAVNAVSAITQLVALSGTTRVYVCSYSLSVATTSGVGTLQFSYGTGTTCGTGTGTLTGPISLVASTPDNVGSVSPQFNTPAGNALCLTATGTGASASGYVTYGQI